MNINFYNCPEPETFSAEILPKEDPLFLAYKPDFLAMEKLKNKYGGYENYLVIANGGSINSFYAFYSALKYKAESKAYFLSTLDPDYIYELKEFLKPENTLVLCISKSGENVMQLEMAMAFASYKMVVITEQNTPLFRIAQNLKLDIVIHSKIGGRYTAFTEVALFPALLCGMNVQELYDGGKELLSQYNQSNIAFKSASVFFQLEEKGFVDIFMPIYSRNLFPFSAIAVQLCHESFGKGGKGQTVLAFEAPESQHHTNQRFFGGTKNMCGLFMGVENFRHHGQNHFPEKVHNVEIKKHKFLGISGVPLEKAMEFELASTLKDAEKSGIPVAHLSVTDFSYKEIARLMAFWQLFALYSSVLRGVNPFDQPQVETSKNMSFLSRLSYAGGNPSISQ